MASKNQSVASSQGELVVRTALGPVLKVPILFPADEGRTKQSFKDECDINVLMKRYEDTGSLEHVNKRVALYRDVTAENFQDAMELLANARGAFMDLPASVRDRFDNDPAKMLAFVEDPDNLAEAESMGLLSPEGSARAAQEAADAHEAATQVAANRAAKAAQKKEEKK